MKLRGLVPNFYIHVSGSYLYNPMTGLIWKLYFPVLPYCVRELSAQPQKQREGQGTAAKHWLRQFPALPSATAVEPRVHMNDQHTNIQFGKIKIINGNNESL
jgi:hypothetical protein